MVSWYPIYCGQVCGWAGGKGSVSGRGGGGGGEWEEGGRGGGAMIGPGESGIWGPSGCQFQSGSSPQETFIASGPSGDRVEGSEGGGVSGGGGRR